VNEKAMAHWAGGGGPLRQNKKKFGWVRYEDSDNIFLVVMCKASDIKDVITLQLFRARQQKCSNY
jgi:hypothetical protein